MKENIILDLGLSQFISFCHWNYKNDRRLYFLYIYFSTSILDDQFCGWWLFSCIPPRSKTERLNCNPSSFKLL